MKTVSTNFRTRSGKAIVQDAKSGFFYVEGSNQIDSLNENRMELGSYRHVEFENRIVLDLGANSGSFNRLAAQGKCLKYVGVEADDDNFDALCLNADTYPEVETVLINKAVIGSDAPTVTFLSAESGNTLIGSVKTDDSNTRGRLQKEVPAVNFWKLLDEHRPQVIKCDIEGGEFDLFTDNLPDCVLEVVMEIHVFNKEDRIMALWKTIWGEVFRGQGWKPTLQPIWTPRNFGTFNGLNCIQMGWRRDAEWVAKSETNKIRGATTMLKKHFGTGDRSVYQTDPACRKYFDSFFKGTGLIERWLAGE